MSRHPFTDAETAQQDAAATRHAQADDWRTTKTTKSAGLHPLFAEILAAHGMPQADQNATLQAAADKAAPRRFQDDARITAMGDLS
jgi:hypothetical protein